MADFLGSSNDWDLEAIIRGWGGAGEGGCAVVQPPPPSPAPLLGFQSDDQSEFVGKGVVFNELEEMWKPFVEQKARNESLSPQSSTQTETTSACSSPSVQVSSSCKKRKSKHTIVRVVHQGVAEDAVLMDKWNWRKYGQKSIKGSPYPRSYYRCSSSGGCHARKHVEQSKHDCHSFIVTYIADHSHAPPTRRHAQAGRKITKFSSTSASATSADNTQKKTTTDRMTWTVSDPWISEDGDQRSASGLEGMGELFKTGGLEYEFNNWEFDPIFSAYIC